MQDLRLPKFDKNRHINQQKVLVFDNDNSNTISSWLQTCSPRLDSSQTTQKENWNGLISPSHFTHLKVWIQMHLTPWKTCFTSKSKTSSLVKIATEILDAKYEKTDINEVMKGLTHLNAHQKADLPWVLWENKKVFGETLNVYSHKKGTFWHWSKCQGCVIYASPSTSNPFEDFQKGRQQSTLDQQLTSTEQSHLV